MTLTANSSQESARRKVFMTSTCFTSRKYESKVFWAQQTEMTLTANSSRRKVFMTSTCYTSRKYESKVFGLSRPK